MEEYVSLDKQIEITDIRGGTIKTTVRHILDRNYARYDVQPVVQWVSVKDKLPEESGTYLVSGKHPDSQAQVWVCSFLCLGIASGWVNSCKNPAVSFWMPLPEPPEVET